MQESLRSGSGSTEESQSSSSSPTSTINEAAANSESSESWHLVQSAAITESAAATNTATAMVTATATAALTSKSATVQRVTERLPASTTVVYRHSSRRLLRQAVGHRRQPLLHDQASSDESAQDADDEADDDTSTEAAGFRVANTARLRTSRNLVVALDDLDDDENLNEGQADFVVIRAIEAESEDDQEVDDIQSSEESIEDGTQWQALQATNDDFVEFVVDDATPGTASTANGRGQIGAFWSDRMRQASWRLFRRRRAAEAGAFFSASHRAHNRESQAPRRRSLPVHSSVRWHPTPEKPRLYYSDDGYGVTADATKILASASNGNKSVPEEVSLSSELMRQLLNESETLLESCLPNPPSRLMNVEKCRASC